jgi:hypothetical protein
MTHVFKSEISTQSKCSHLLHHTTPLTCTQAATQTAVRCTNYRHNNSSQGDWPKERLQAGTGEKKVSQVKTLDPSKKLCCKIATKNVRVTILLTDIALVSYITLVFRLV